MVKVSKASFIAVLICVLIVLLCPFCLAKKDDSAVPLIRMDKAFGRGLAAYRTDFLLADDGKVVYLRAHSHGSEYYTAFINEKEKQDLFNKCVKFLRSSSLCCSQSTSLSSSTAIPERTALCVKVNGRLEGCEWFNNTTQNNIQNDLSVVDEINNFDPPRARLWVPDAIGIALPYSRTVGHSKFIQLPRKAILKLDGQNLLVKGRFFQALANAFENDQLIKIDENPQIFAITDAYYKNLHLGIILKKNKEF